jgi:small-conductance mechanosensitive channel
MIYDKSLEGITVKVGSDECDNLFNICYCCKKFGYHTAVVKHKAYPFSEVCTQIIRDLSGLPASHNSEFTQFDIIEDPVILALSGLKRKIRSILPEELKTIKEYLKISKKESAEIPGNEPEVVDPSFFVFNPEIAEKSIKIACDTFAFGENVDTDKYLEAAKKIYDFLKGESKHFKGDKK